MRRRLFVRLIKRVALAAILGTAILAYATIPAFAAAGDGLLPYGSRTSGSRGQNYRTWVPTSMGAETSILGTNITTQWTVLKSSPVNSGAYVMAMVTSEASNNFKVYSSYNGTWTSEFTYTQSAAQYAYRLFDVAYENASGKVMVIYGKSTSTTTAYYRIGTWNSGTSHYDWTTEASFSLTTSIGNLRWFILANKLNSNNMILTAVGSNTTGNNINARVWNGSAWGTEGGAWGLVNVSTNWDFDCAYETASGNGMVAWGFNGSPYWKYARLVGSTWTVSNGPTTNLNTNIRELAVAADPRPTSNLIAVALQETTANNHVNGAVWNGSAWTGPTEVNANTNTASYGRVVDVCFAGSSGNAVLLWDGTTSGTAGLGWALSQNGAAFAAQTIIALTGGNNEYNIQLVSDAASNTIMYIRRDSSYDLYYYYFNGNTNTWTTATGAAIETDSSPNNDNTKESYMFAYESVYRVPTLGWWLMLALIVGFMFFAVRRGAVQLKKERIEEPREERK